MRRDDLKKIEGLTSEQIDAIMKLHGTDTSEWNQKLEEQKKEIQKRDDTINELTEKVKTYDGVDVAKLQSDLSEWEEKYNKDMAAKDKDFAKRMYFSTIQFNSNLAKKAAMEAFDEKNLEFKDGKFVGADEFIEDLKKSDPQAFRSTDPDPKPKGKGAPMGGRAPGSDDLDGVEERFYELNPGLKK